MTHSIRYFFEKIMILFWLLVEHLVQLENSIKRIDLFQCLVSILSCHGWKIHTNEGIGNSEIGFHNLQKLLAANNGSQCGFCSSGMVMNMFALLKSGSSTQKQIEDSFGGNICRCTGYRSIIETFKKLAPKIGKMFSSMRMI